jgi:hypothetical protein
MLLAQGFGPDRPRLDHSVVKASNFTVSDSSLVAPPSMISYRFILFAAVLLINQGVARAQLILPSLVKVRPSYKKYRSPETHSYSACDK